MSANRSFAHEDPAWTSLAGRPCIVVGNSPAERIAATGILSARFTIGVNRALRTWSPSALVIVDRGVIRKEADNCRSYRGMLLFWDRLNDPGTSNIPGCVFALKGNTGVGQWEWPKRPQDHLIRAGTTPAYAIQLAMGCGMSPIGLLGVDFSAPSLHARKENTHSYGPGRPEGATGGGKFQGNSREFFTRTPNEAHSRGIEVFNLSPDDNSPFTADSGWCRMSVEDFVTYTEERELAWRAHKHAGARPERRQGSERERERGPKQGGGGNPVGSAEATSRESLANAASRRDRQLGDDGRNLPSHQPSGSERSIAPDSLNPVGFPTSGRKLRRGNGRLQVCLRDPERRVRDRRRGE